MTLSERVLRDVNMWLREQHGRSILYEDKLIESGVDSFGLTMVIMELDNKYECFSKEWMNSTDLRNVTVLDIIDRVKYESPVL